MNIVTWNKIYSKYYKNIKICLSEGHVVWTLVYIQFKLSFKLKKLSCVNGIGSFKQIMLVEEYKDKIIDTKVMQTMLVQ